MKALMLVGEAWRLAVKYRVLLLVLHVAIPRTSFPCDALGLLYISVLLQTSMTPLAQVCSSPHVILVTCHVLQPSARIRKMYSVLQLTRRSKLRCRFSMSFESTYNLGVSKEFHHDG